MTLESWEWGNQEQILQRKQQRAARQARVCHGCIHKREIAFKSEVIMACALKRGNPTIYCNFKQTEKAA